MKDNTCNDVFCKDAINADVEDLAKFCKDVKVEDRARDESRANFCTKHYNNEWYNACMYALVDGRVDHCEELLSDLPNKTDVCKAFSELYGYGL